MRNLILAVVLVLAALISFSASAQQRPAQAPTAPTLPTISTEGISTAKVLAIGVGALLGAVAAEAILAGDGVSLLGGAVGGVLAAWWYDSASGGPSRAALRQPAVAPIPARAESLALAR